MPASSGISEWRRRPSAASVDQDGHNNADARSNCASRRGYLRASLKRSSRHKPRRSDFHNRPPWRPFLLRPKRHERRSRHPIGRVKDHALAVRHLVRRLSYDAHMPSDLARWRFSRRGIRKLSLTTARSGARRPIGIRRGGLSRRATTLRLTVFLVEPVGTHGRRRGTGKNKSSNMAEQILRVPFLPRQSQFPAWPCLRQVAWD